MKTKAYRVVYYVDGERYVSEMYRTKELAEKILGSYARLSNGDCSVICTDEAYSEVLDIIKEELV